MSELNIEKKEEQINEIRDIIDRMIEEKGMAYTCGEINSVMASIGRNVSNKNEESLFNVLKNNNLPIGLVVDAIGNDAELFEDIADFVDEVVSFKYEEDSLIELKEKMIVLENAALLVHNFKKHIKPTEMEEDSIEATNYLKSIIAEKIEQMDYMELYTFLSEFEGETIIFDDSYYNDCIKSQIESMSIGELTHFLHKHYSMNDEMHSHLKEKILENSSQYLESIYNKLYHGNLYREEDIQKLNHNAYTLKKLDILRQTAKDKVDEKFIKSLDEEDSSGEEFSYEDEMSQQKEYQYYLKYLRGLNNTELMIYMFQNFKKMDNGYLYAEERKVMVEKLKELPNEDLWALYYRVYEEQENDPGAFNEEDVDNNIIYKAAEEKGFFDPNKPDLDSGRGWDKYEEMLEYSEISLGRLMRDKKRDIDEDELSSEYGGDKFLLKLHEKIRDAEEAIEAYEALDELSETDDKRKIITAINAFNGMKNYAQIPAANDFQEFYKYSIYSLPAIYSTMFRNGNNRVLNSAMDLKIDEFQNEISKFNQAEIEKEK